MILNSAGVYLGNWTLYSASAPVELAGIPDPFRKPASVRDWLASNSIAALLSSWPDDTNWVLYLKPGLLQHELNTPS
jgi:hypothetical protein